MNGSSSNHVQLSDHVLYKLKDKAGKVVKGFAFVDQEYDISEGGLEFVPARDHVCSPVTENHAEFLKFFSEAIYNEDFIKPDINTLETDLNLSEASSINDTTLEECPSVTSFISPTTLPKFLSHHDETPHVPSAKTAKSSVCQNTAKFIELSPSVKIYNDGYESIKKDKDVLDDAPRDTLLSSTITSLAAEVVHEVKAKAALLNNDKNAESTPSPSVKVDGPASSSEVMEYFENKRNAKEEMSKEEFKKLSKPFSFGWKREVVIHAHDSYDIKNVYYIPPSHGHGRRVEGKRLRNPALIAKYLSQEGKTDLSLENFSTTKVFLGFGSRFEVLRNSFKSPTLEIGKYDNFCDVVSDGQAAGSRFKCLLCGHLFTQKGNFARHVKVVHEPDVKCELCGKEFRPIHIEHHNANCNEQFKNTNEKDKIVAKRKFPQAKVKAVKVPKNEHSQSGIHDTSSIKPIARKSSPPTLPVSTTSAIPSKEEEVVDKISGPLILNNNLDDDYCEIIEPGDDCGEIRDKVAKNETIESSVCVEHVDSISEHTEEKFHSSNIEMSIPTPTPPTHSQFESIESDISARTNSPICMATLEMASLEGTLVRMKVKVNAKLWKGMKKFGVRMGVNYKDLRFVMDGKELTGEESAGKMDGAKILVERRLS